MKFKDFQAPVLFSSTFKALNSEEKNSSTFNDAWEAGINGGCPKPDKVGGLWQKAHQRKNGGDDGGGSLISLDGVTPSQMVGVSASVTFPCTIKVQKKTSSGTSLPR